MIGSKAISIRHNNIGGVRYTYYKKYFITACRTVIQRGRPTPPPHRRRTYGWWWFFETLLRVSSHAPSVVHSPPKTFRTVRDVFIIIVVIIIPRFTCYIICTIYYYIYFVSGRLRERTTTAAAKSSAMVGGARVWVIARIILIGTVRHTIRGLRLNK